LYTWVKDRLKDRIGATLPPKVLREVAKGPIQAAAVAGTDVLVVGEGHGIDLRNYAVGIGNPAAEFALIRDVGPDRIYLDRALAVNYPSGTPIIVYVGYIPEKLPPNTILHQNGYTSEGYRSFQTVDMDKFWDMFGAQFPAVMPFGSKPRVYDKLEAADAAGSLGYRPFFDDLRDKGVIG
jgi:hypothetical protein